MKRRVTRLAFVVTVILVFAQPAGASRFGPSGFPQDYYKSYPFENRGFGQGPALFVKDAVNPHKWVWTLDPSIYGATGTITFYDYANAIKAYEDGLPADPLVPSMQGPGGTGVNEWRVCAGLAADRCDPGENPFDFSRPSFTQDVDVVPADFLTPDPPHDIRNDYDPTLYHPDAIPDPNPFGDFPQANMDGSANLFKLAFTVAPGTQFMNMQVDRSGNYYVARRDMQWDWIDYFTYKHGNDPVQVADTQFNVQPYPISDAFGWCGALPPRDPNSLTGMAGQLIKDIAFDVYADDARPDQGIPPFTTEVVPSFQMRSFGIYVIDVTMLSFGVRQQFTTIAKGVHFRPVDETINGVTYKAGTQVQPGDPDFKRWFNRVSPFAAGVVPKGAWVINDGSRYMQVVPPGTPGAVWHQNKFAGAAYAVRGDMERRVNFINLDTGGWASNQHTTSEYNEMYYSAIQSGAINPNTGQPWKRADWTDWKVGGQEVLPDAY